jgi:AcrB/AcrD/AcrF family/Barrel-sandwich domain of CusB or HlyD membrane-fusion
MWIVNLALRRPYTFIVLAIFILLSGGLAILKTPKDIFPSVNIPVVAVVWTYTGMEPTEVTNHITSVYERVLTTTVNNIEHIESQSLSGVAVVKIFLQPTADVTAGIAEITAVSQAILKQLPPGVAPPEILSYNATDVPVLRLGLGGRGFSEQQFNDYATNFVRPQLITVPGAVVPSPYGGKERYVEVNLNYQAMQARGVTPAEVISAVNAQNLILPSGTAKIGQFEYQVGINASPPAIRDLNTLPIKTVNGATIYMRDIGNVINGNIPQTNVVRFKRLQSLDGVSTPVNHNSIVGDLVVSGSGKRLFIVDRQDPLRVYVHVPENFARQVQVGTKANLSLDEFPGRLFPATVVTTSKAVDPSNRTHLVELHVLNPTHELWPGAYTEVHFHIESAGSAVQIPANTLLFRNGASAVGVVGADGKVEIRNVQIGKDLGTSLQIVKGVSATDQLIVNPSDSLNQGMEVHVVGSNQSSDQAG